MHRSSPFSLWPILISAQNHRALFLLQGMRRQKRRVDEQLAEKCTHGENCGFCGHTGHPDSACPKRKRFAEVAQQRVADSAEGLESLEVRRPVIEATGEVAGPAEWATALVVALLQLRYHDKLPVWSSLVEERRDSLPRELMRSAMESICELVAVNQHI